MLNGINLREFPFATSLRKATSPLASNAFSICMRSSSVTRTETCRPNCYFARILWKPIDQSTPDSGLHMLHRFPFPADRLVHCPRLVKPSAVLDLPTIHIGTFASTKASANACGSIGALETVTVWT
jgi:hypothetical protein